MHKYYLIIKKKNILFYVNNHLVENRYILILYHLFYDNILCILQYSQNIETSSEIMQNLLILFVSLFENVSKFFINTPFSLFFIFQN